MMQVMVHLGLVMDPNVLLGQHHFGPAHSSWWQSRSPCTGTAPAQGCRQDHLCPMQAPVQVCVNEVSHPAQAGFRPESKCNTGSYPELYLRACQHGLIANTLRLSLTCMCLYGCDSMNMTGCVEHTWDALCSLHLLTCLLLQQGLSWHVQQDLLMHPPHYPVCHPPSATAGLGPAVERCPGTPV
jgi:hypothetical protein